MGWVYSTAFSRFLPPIDVGIQLNAIVCILPQSPSLMLSSTSNAASSQNPPRPPPIALRFQLDDSIPEQQQPPAAQAQTPNANYLSDTSLRYLTTTIIITANTGQFIYIYEPSLPQSRRKKARVPSHYAPPPNALLYLFTPVGSNCLSHHDGQMLVRPPADLLPTRRH